MKRWISILLVVIMLFTLTACESNTAGEKDTDATKQELVVKEGVPSYADDEEIQLAAYAGPRRAGYRNYNGILGAHPDDPEEGWEGWITEEGFQDYMDCGFTYLLPEFDALYDTNKPFLNSDLYHYMELAEKMNIPVVVSAEQLILLTSSDDYRLNDDLKAMLTELVGNLSGYTTFKGFSFRDEPNYEHAKTFGAVQDYLNGMKSDLFYFTSMLPIYADPLRFTDNYNGNVEDAYKDYVNAYVDQTGTFAYDHYPLYLEPVSGETRLDSTWLQNLRLVAEIAKEKKCDTGITIQSCAFGQAGKQNTNEYKRAVTTKADVSFQAYSALAYGMDYLTYFTYWEHWNESDAEDFYSAMVHYPEQNGGEPVKTEAYYAVKEVNEEIKKFDHVFLKFDWEGTMGVTKKDTAKSPMLAEAGKYSSPRIEKVEATDETIIGCMKDADGYDGFMIVNVTDPGKNLSDEVTVTFKEATKAIVYVKGEEQTVDLKDGSYTFDLTSGEGVFVIPLV